MCSITGGRVCRFVFKKHSIDLTGMLQYCMNKLKSRESFDLIIVKELITRMAGIECVEDATSDQLAALAGGDTLRQEGGSFIIVNKSQKRVLQYRLCWGSMRVFIQRILLQLICTAIRCLM